MDEDMDQSVSSMDEEVDNTDNEDSIDMGHEHRNIGNRAWAKAISKVLRSKVPNEKNFILSKAKKDSEVKEKKQSNEIQIVDDSGNIIQTKEVDTTELQNLKRATKRKEMSEKMQKKTEWESMNRVKPDVMHKDLERMLIRIATRGVVQLFNAVETHQKLKINKKTKGNEKRKAVAKAKGNFMDMLKGQTSSNNQTMRTNAPAQKESWGVLKEDFMMGGTLKDWDKDSDEDVK